MSKELEGLYCIYPEWELFEFFTDREFEYAWQSMTRADWMMWMSARLLKDANRSLGALASCCADESEGIPSHYGRFTANLWNWVNGNLSNEDLDRVTVYLVDHLERKGVESESEEILLRLTHAITQRKNCISLPYAAANCLRVRDNQQSYLTLLKAQFSYEEIRDSLLKLSEQRRQI